jgi:hypothetical protein
MSNEVQINVSMADGTGPGKDEIKASVKQFGESLPPIKVTATNPIDEAYVAEVRAQIQSLEAESFEIPVTADTEEARTEIEATLEALREKAEIDVSLESPNAGAFNDEVLADIEALPCGSVLWWCRSRPARVAWGARAFRATCCTTNCCSNVYPR